MHTSLVHTAASLQGSDGEFIPVSEVHELHDRSYDIVDNSVSQLFGNTAGILSYVLILLPGSVVKSWVHSSPFFTI